MNEIISLFALALSFEVFSTQAPCVPSVQKTKKVPMKWGNSRGRSTWARECYRQNHPDRTNLRILNFAGNKDLAGNSLIH
jgi:hypothetical protein